jgi:hypothetical protein
MLRKGALCAILLLVATPAFADKCTNAVNEFNSKLDAEASWRVQTFKEARGVRPEEDKEKWDVDFCKKFRPVLDKRLALEQELARLDAIQHKVCRTKLYFSGGHKVNIPKMAIIVWWIEFTT